MNNKSAKADEAVLSEMHGLMAQVMLEKLRTGNLVKGDLNVIRQFLKDNAIDCYGPENETLGSIVSELPKFDTDFEDAYGTVIPLKHVNNG